MKAATINEIKNELLNTPSPVITELCLRLARFKKENKELLTYLLFEASDEESYIAGVQKEIEEGFQTMNTSSVYLAKKTIRKVLRTTNKYIRYTGSKAVEVELLLHFCKLLIHSGLKFKKSNALNNLYDNQLKKIHLAISSFHEDLQYDYLKELALLTAEEPSVINRLSSFLTRKPGKSKRS